MIGIIRADGSIIRLEFMHTNGISALTPNGVDYGKDSLTRYRTECRLVTGPKETPIQLAHGNAFCSIYERLKPFQSIREQGRVRSMKRALFQARTEQIISTEEMGMLFEAYRKRPRGKWAKKSITTQEHQTS